MKRTIALLLALVLAFTCFSTVMADEGEVTPPPVVTPEDIEATDVKLDASEAILFLGETKQLKATVSPENTTDKSLAWISSDKSVVKVDTKGNVTAVAAGKAIVICTTLDGSQLTAYCKFTVGKKAEALQLDKEALSLAIGATGKLEATITPEDAIVKELDWKSSNEAVATVDKDGNVTAVKEGTATITATTTDGTNFSDECAVTVGKAVEAIELDKETLELAIGMTGELKITLAPEDAIVKNIEWKSSDEAVATVDTNGIVTAIAEGTATITATTTDGSSLSDECTVTVGKVIDSFVLNAHVIKWPLGKAGRFKPVIGPEDAIVKTIKWVSSDEAVATVDENGKLTAVGYGTAVITATTTDGSNIVEECTVTVGKAAETLKLNAHVIKWPVNKAGHFKPVVTPADQNKRKRKWTSSNTKVATVNENGKLTAVSAGTAVITCTTTDGSNLTDTCRVTVYAKKATALKLNVSKLTWPVGKAGHFKPTVSPSDASSKTLVWTSSNTKVATVDANGKLTARAVGTAIITCKTTDGSNLKATCTVTVTVPAPQNVKVSKVTSSISEIKWDKTAGATAYYVYRSTTKDGGYKRIATTSATKIKDTGLTAGKTYYYKIKGYRYDNDKQYVSSSSAAASIKM